MPLSKSDRAQSFIWRLRWQSVLIGDQEREKVTDYLALARSEGFLTEEDFGKRVDLALSARYYHELCWAKNELPANIQPRPKPTPPAFAPDWTLSSNCEGFDWDWTLAVPIILGVALAGWIAFMIYMMVNIHG